MATSKNRHKTLKTLSLEEVQPQFSWVKSIRKAPVPARFPTGTECYSFVFSRFLSINERQSLENFLYKKFEVGYYGRRSAICCWKETSMSFILF